METFVHVKMLPFNDIVVNTEKSSINSFDYYTNINYSEIDFNKFRDLDPTASIVHIVEGLNPFVSILLNISQIVYIHNESDVIVAYDRKNSKMETHKFHTVRLAAPRAMIGGEAGYNIKIDHNSLLNIKLKLDVRPWY